MKKLIVNADGYGFTPGVNRGIEETLKHGVVRSISCTPNFGLLGGLGDLGVAHPQVSIGVHVNLSVGRPVSRPDAIPTLVGDSGEFLGDALFARLLFGHVRQADIVRELRAQVRVVKDMQVAITHIDGHQNRHLYPRYFAAVLQVAREFGIRGLRCHRRVLWSASGPLDLKALAEYYRTHPARALSHMAARVRMRQAESRGMMMADGLITPGYADSSHKSQEAFWTSMGHSLPCGTWEVYCHPAYVDEALRANARYVEPREAERVILSSPTVREGLESAGVELCSFFDVVGEGA